MSVPLSSSVKVAASRAVNKGLNRTAAQTGTSSSRSMITTTTTTTTSTSTMKTSDIVTDHSKHPSSQLVITDEFRSDLHKFVKSAMSGFDSSHDWFHVMRVTNLALEIGRKEGDHCDLPLIEVCALLHDVWDHKYYHRNLQDSDGIMIRSDNDEDDPKQKELRDLCLIKHKDSCHITSDILSRIQLVISHVSYSKEIRLRNAAELSSDRPDQFEAIAKYEAYQRMFKEIPELSVVQDADRLDAIGAIGIARTFCFSGARGRALFNFEDQKSDNQERMEHLQTWIDEGNADDTTVGHFYDKLLKLQSMMKTQTGRIMAEQRTKFMQNFLDQFYEEWNC